MLVTMSDKEISRINVIQSVVEKRMRRRDAAHQLALTERQTQRLMNRFRESGAAGLVNLRRGRPGNHRVVIAAAATVMIVIRPTPRQAALAEVVEAVAVVPAAVQSLAGQNRDLPFPTQPPKYNLSHRFAKR